MASIDKLIRIDKEGSSETTLHFIFRYNGDSVGRYKRYRRVDCMYRGYLKGYITVTEVPYTSDYLEES